MSRHLSPSECKLAEKLCILNERGVGMLTRIYNIKKACGDAKSKPSFLSDKSLEATIKNIVRRFPSVDPKAIQQLHSIRSDVIKSLSLYYFTFVDLLDFKDHVCELLTSMDAWQVTINISYNFCILKNYLDLMCTYVSLMILLSKVEDRKAVLGLFNAAYELTHSVTDPNFPRLGQMIIDYENPVKKLAEEFLPHSNLLKAAIASLQPIYEIRNCTAKNWRADKKLSLVGNPNQLLKPVNSDHISCEYISLLSIERWIVFGCLTCHQVLQNDKVNSMWIAVLESCWVMPLFRDEVIYIHAYIQSFFESLKGYGKRVSEVKESYTQAVSKAGHNHRERRKFLRTALKELCLILSDQPGLFGPKALVVFSSLSYAKDEIFWLLRHNDNPPIQKTKGKLTEDLIDRQLPELLFHVEELRALIRKYSQVIQRYYVQYLSQFDAFELNRLVENKKNYQEDESVILTSIYNTLIGLSLKQVDEDENFNFNALRLDLFRLQTFMSMQKPALPIKDNVDLALFFDTVLFHTRMVDNLDEIIVETSDLSLFCFYNKFFEDQFHMCLEFPAQNRYIIAFPLICAHFQNCTHDLCPEERHHIRDRSLSIVNIFLDEMAKEAKNIITAICEEQSTLSDRLLPKYCATQVSNIVNRKKKEKTRKLAQDIEKPGQESYRKTREHLTTMDKLHMALTELCFAINYNATIHVWDYIFSPKEYLSQHLEQRFSKALVGMVMYHPDSSEIAKPSELLSSVKAYVSVLQTVENYVHLDMTRIFNNCFLQQTQNLDPFGEKTIASIYTQWYSEVLLRRVSAGNICFSNIQKAFVSLTPEGCHPFNPEEFSDINELRALSELIGPYGIRLLNETLMWYIASQVNELKKLTDSNQEILKILRSNFDKPKVMKEQFQKLQNVESLLQRMTIIGVIMSFKNLVLDCLSDVLEERIPFLLSSISDFKNHLPSSEPVMIASDMAAAAGLPCKLDPLLINSLRSQKSERELDDHMLACLLMVFVAVSIPKLAKNENSIFKTHIGGHANNIHCVSLGINFVFGCLFAVCGQNDLEDRMKEFLALASSSLLRLGLEADKECTKNRESVYLLLSQIVQDSPFLTMDLLESCFPYVLIRNAYHDVHKLNIF